MDKQKLKKIIPALIIALGLAIAWSFLARTGIIAKGNHIVKVSGNMETDDVRISFRTNGQIEKLLTDEGRAVKADDIVATLKTDELTKIRDEEAAQLKAAEHEYDLAKIDYERAENLLKAGSVTRQKRDAAKTKHDSSSARVNQLRASLELALTRLGFAELRSPLNGFILVKSAREGEVVGAGQTIFTATDLSDIWVTAYINETDLARVKLNQEADIVTDTYPGKKYKGRVSFISQEAEFTPKQIQTTEERVKLVYRVKIQADNSSLDLKPGMPADAYIHMPGS
ncbi:MAG: efflux RND transporter periplasmic adaptor subunit [Candidatus Omnitrophica bacterium]|nr:efflux RND transporter periplasmic adaptor subunit [Candidatus Omnitrophota bacterium]